MVKSMCVQLLNRIRAEDRAFLDDLANVVTRIARKWNWTDRDSVEDITQDCYVKIIGNLQAGRFEGRSSFKTYVYTIVRLTCIDYYRAATAVATTDIDNVTLVDPAASPDEKLLTEESRLIACRVLLGLPSDCRRLWRTVFFGRRNYRQAAERLGLKEGTVKRRMWECRQIARELVQRLEK